jgi:hypothetical protein
MLTQRFQHRQVLINIWGENDMQLKLANGVTVSIREDEGTKLLVFDHNVRAIALESTEATRIGALLYRSKNSVIFPTLVSLVESGFFDQPRTFVDVRNTMRSLNPNTKLSSLSMALSKLHEKKILSRTGNQRQYVYRRR